MKYVWKYNKFYEELVYENIRVIENITENEIIHETENEIIHEIIFISFTDISQIHKWMLTSPNLSF